MTTIYNSNYDGTHPFSDTAVQVGLSANSEHTYTVPGTNVTQYQASFEYTYNANIYICLNATPTVPALGSVGTQAYNQFRPQKVYVKGGDVIHFITPDTSAYFGFSLMQLQG